MFTPLKAPASHVVAIAFEGEVTPQDVEAVVETVEEALERSERLNLLFDLTALKSVKPSAVIKDLAFSLRNLGRLYRFQQMAVITDNESLSKAVEWEDWLFRSIAIKRFSSGERDHALSWVEQKLDLPDPGFSPQDEGDYLRLLFSKELTGYDVLRLSDLIRERYEEHGPVRILAQTDVAPRYGQGVLYEKLRQFKLVTLIARCAVVGPASLTSQITAFNTVLNTRLKHFPAERLEDAIAWVTDTSPSVEVLPTDSEGRFALRISGKITSVEVESFYAALLPHLEGDDSIDVLVEVPYQDGITLKAIYKMVKLGIKHYTQVTKGVRRLAIITDSRFLSKATEVENLLIPSVEERPFTFNQRDIAIAWLNEGRQPELGEAPTRALHDEAQGALSHPTGTHS